MVDTRRMTRKSTPDDQVGTGSTLHPTSSWEKGHQVYMFLEDKNVCSFVIPLLPTGPAVSGVLESMPLCFDGIKYEDEGAEIKEEPEVIPAPKRSKRSDM